MIKNLKVNYSKFKTKTKFKLKKVVIKGIAIISAATLSLTSCKLKSDNYNSSYDYNSNYTYTSTNDLSLYEDNENIEKFDNPLTKTDSNPYSRIEIETTDLAYNEFIDYINNNETNYTYEELYNIDIAYQKYQEVKDLKATKHTSKISEITEETLYETVKKNNKIFLEQKKKEYVEGFYEEFSSKELKNFCKIIVDTINYYISKGKVEDLEEVKCILGNLKIFSKVTLTNAHVTDDNCLIISPSMIEAVKIKATSKDQDITKDVISHESYHMLQKGCSDNNKLKYSIGHSYKFEDLEVNPLYWNWFYEGSAEKGSNNYTGDTPLFYTYYVNYINTLSLTTILKDDNYVNQLEETTLSNSLDKFFDVFGCENETDKKEIIKMMYSLDIIETDDEGFIKAYNPNITETELIKVKRNLKVSVGKTLSKVFYKNLATQVKNGNLSLHDIYYLITIFESDMDTHLTYTDSEKYNENKEFINNYVEIQSNFFYFLSSNSKYSQNDIEIGFDNYAINLANNQQNYDLTKIEQSKKEFINEMYENLKNNRTEQIKDTYEKIQNKQK